MSWEASAWAKKTRGHNAISDKLVLMVLTEYANPETWEAWPSHSVLAEDSGELSKRTLINSLQSLESNGFITRTQRGNQHQPSIYVLHPAQVQAMAPTPIDAGVSADSAQTGVSASNDSSPQVLPSQTLPSYSPPSVEPSPLHWRATLRQIEGWGTRGEPHEPAMMAWVDRNTWTEDQLEASAIGLSQVQMKTLKGYSNLASAFQRRVREGYDDSSRNGREPVDLSSDARLDELRALAAQQEAERAKGE